MHDVVRNQCFVSPVIGSVGDLSLNQTNVLSNKFPYHDSRCSPSNHLLWVIAYEAWCKARSTHCLFYELINIFLLRPHLRHPPFLDESSKTNVKYQMRWKKSYNSCCTLKRIDFLVVLNNLKIICTLPYRICKIVMKGNMLGFWHLN